MKKTPVLLFGMLLGELLVGQSMASDQRNLLANPAFDFHSYINHRDCKAISYSAQNVACWNTDGAGDITVQRSSHTDRKLHPPVFFRNGVKIEPGKRMLQFFTLPEAQLLPGDSVSLKFYATPGIKGTLRLMKFDSEDGTWSPSDFGMADKRSFPKHSRGELVVADAVEVRSPGDGIAAQACVLEGFQVRSTFNDKNESDSSAIFAAGLEVEFANESGSAAWVFAPSLIKSQTAEDAVGELRETPEIYRHIPRTIQKLWKGEPIHIIIMGSSIDRGSANPPMYPYNEDSSSPDFKKPLCDAYDGSFSAEMLGRADLAEHLAQPRHYFSYGGRLKRELMVKFNLPADKILLNFMAADGSCVGESHSGLRAYCELSIPPGPGDNGHKSGKTWQELYPALFSRPGGSGPGNLWQRRRVRKTDTPDEVAVFGGHPLYSAQLSQHGIPVLHVPKPRRIYTKPRRLAGHCLALPDSFIDFGLVSDLVNTHGNRYAQVPIDGHPQAAAHYLWFKQLEKAFECHDQSPPARRCSCRRESTRTPTVGKGKCFHTTVAARAYSVRTHSS